ncbi:MAG: hypothetical protein JO332_01465, partial [Planctomycetaceae bacterium]|nr:hypothetical protein [Planctomycetaceae bacterium]
AFRVRDQASCENCLGEIIAPLSLEEQQEILLQVKALKDSQVLEELPLAPSEAINQEEFFELDAPEPQTNTDDFFELDTPEKRAARTRKAVPVMSKTQAAEESQNRAVVIFLFCLVGIAALGSFLYYGSGGEYTSGAVIERPTPPPYNPTPKTYGSAGADPRAEEAKSLLAKAADFARANPIDLAGQQEAYKKALDFAVGSSWGPDAKREYDGVLQRHKDLLAKDFDAIDKETAAAVDKEDFKAAMDRLEQAKPKYNVGEWRGGIDLRTRNLKNSIWKTLFPLRDKAVEAKAAKKDADVKTIVDRVAKWGLPEFSRELDNALGAGAAGTPTTTTKTPTDVSPASAELKSYEIRWRQAMELATLRNYDGALAALDKGAADLKETDSKAALAADKDVLARVQAFYKDALQVLSLWKRNEKIPLESYDENLNYDRSEDPFLRADAERVEVVRAGAPYAIEISEMTSRSLATLLRRSKPNLPEADLRAAALFCLLEGEMDAARSNFTGPAEQIPYKYWALASKIAEARASTSDANKRELAARRTYFAAEHGYADVKTRAVAVQNYRELLTLFPGTAIVERHRAQIAARRDGARDYVFLADDMDGAGTFNKSGKQPKYGECWTSIADSDPSRGAHNYVNVKFYAFPDVTYQCWAYVGACCIETFAAYYQATDLTYTKGSEVLKLDPGSNASLPVRNSITFLKKTHAEHGGPKEAKTWQWAELKLPKFPQAGIKDVRVVTDQKGYSVAFIVVSASRGNPPNEGEMRSWVRKPDPVAVVEEKSTPVEAAVVEARDPSLIGHWKLDELGATAIDASGKDNSGVLVNEPSRVPGKNGGAVALDGKDRYVGIPNSELLDKLQEGTFTVACWFKPNSKPGDGNDPAYAIFAKSPAHEGLTYNADQKFVMDHVLANGQVVSAVSATAFAPGNYYHVAGVVNRSEGAVRLYVNGKQEGQGAFPPSGAAKDFKNETWKIGIAAPGGGAQRLSADGIVDDVRVYNRALQSADLKTIAGIAGGNAPSVVITSPLPGEKFDPNATVVLSATVTPSDRIAKVEFYAGSTLLGTRSGAPYSFTWNKVAGGSYTLLVKALDRSGTVFASSPLQIKVGNPTLYRALNLGGSSVRIGDVDYEGKGARKVSVIGSPIELKLELTPPPDASTAPLLRGGVVQPLGTSVSLIDIPNGSYQIFLLVCSGANSQVYDLHIGGRAVQTKIQSGPPGTWQKLGPWVVDATGGLLEVAAKNGEINFCALEVWRVAK